MSRILAACLPLAASCICLTLITPLAHAEDAQQDVLVDRVVAVVDDHPILLSDVVHRVHLALQRSAQPAPSLDPKMLQEAVEVIVDEKLIEQEAKRRSIVVTEEEVDRAIEVVAKNNELTTERIYEEAAKSGIDHDGYRQAIAASLREQKLLQLDLTQDIQIEDADIREAYEQMLERARKKRPYSVAWIVVRVRQGASEADVAKREKRAREVVRKAQGGTSFAELARAYSDDSATKNQGGDLGRRVPQGVEGGMTLRPDLERHALQLSVGETSEPIRLREGFVILHLLDRHEPAHLAFDEVRDSLKQQLHSKAVARARKAWLQELRNKSCVLLRFTPTGPKGAAQR